MFMPVGTLGAIKALDAQDVANLGASIMLSNAYHLMLRPGHETVDALGGLHQFMGHKKGAILTDSGGFQAFSLASRVQLSDEGVRFASHLDGASIMLTPERLVTVQEALRPDIAMVLDVCPAAGATREVVLEALRRTTAWAKRCIVARSRDDVAWFGIVQGGLHEDLRLAHAASVGVLPFDGFAIGGVSVGESTGDIDRIVRHVAPHLPMHKPRYLMGVGTPEDLIRGVDAGVDMFDCVMPTRNARNGQLFTSTGKLMIKNAAWRRSDAPIDATCGCHTCGSTSRGYLRHLFVAKELTYYRLASIHNIAYYLRLMQRIRQALEAGTFCAAAFLATLQPEGGRSQAHG